MTIKTNATISKVISKSTKRRQGAYYTREGKTLDKKPNYVAPGGAHYTLWQNG